MPLAFFAAVSRIYMVRCGNLTCSTKDETPEVIRSGMNRVGCGAQARRPLVAQATLPMPTGLARPKHCGRFSLVSRFCGGAGRELRLARNARRVNSQQARLMVYPAPPQSRFLTLRAG